MKVFGVLMFLAVTHVMVFGFGWVTGRTSVIAKDLLKYRRFHGFTGGHAKIYKEAINRLNGLVAIDDLRDLAADPDSQVILPPKIREDIKSLLARYRKEKIGEA